MTEANIPPRTLAGLRAYADNRVPTGGFLRAVLENDLSESIGRADPENMAALTDIVAYVFWEVPAKCWGSPEKVAAWLSRVEAGQ